MTNATILPEGTKAAVIADGALKPLHSIEEIIRRGKAGEKVFQTFDGDINGFGQFMSNALTALFRKAFKNRFSVDASMSAEIVDGAVQYHVVANVGDGAFEVQGKCVTAPLRDGDDLYFNLADAADFTKELVRHIALEAASASPTVH